MAVKLHPPADVQMIWNNVAKQFFARKHNSKSLRKGISISQSENFNFSEKCWLYWKIRADWETQVKCNLLADTLIL